MEPGDLHHRLLALPWADVFTTNWDTLLERTRDSTVSPTYEVVRAVDELPLASRPRIVKLHGSLPAHFPLVATAEDYKHYPREFAAFVNTARQALMETVFLLLGFSGDDPNFLCWRKWVRDQLGPSAPKIYLAGWLKLNRSDRKKLEQDGVVPIDLAGHTKHKDWSRRGMEHRFAMEWLLTTLELGEPYPSEEWPKPLPQPRAEVPPYLMPVDREIWRAPRTPSALPADEDSELEDDAVDEIVADWHHNRELFPGWFALPEQLRTGLRLAGVDDVSSDLLEDKKEDRIISAAAHRAPADRIRILHEVIWRREIRLEPLGTELVLASRKALADVLSSTADSEFHKLDRRAVSTVAQALVTHARLQFDRPNFDEAMRVATEFTQHDTNALQNLQYERCLWAVYENDIDGLSEVLDAWQIDAGDPYWTVRKVSLMFESGQSSKQVLPLMRSAVTALRRSRGYSLDISVLARESWAAYLVRRLEKQAWSDADGSDPHRARARDLARFNCDPPAEIRALINAVQLQEDTEKGPGFELGEGARPRGLVEFTQDTQSPAWHRARAAYRIVRLMELAGIPVFSDRWPPTKFLLNRASEALHREGQFEFALRLMLRNTSYDGSELLRKLLSRPSVAIFPNNVVDSIADQCERTIDYFTRRGLHYRNAPGTHSPGERVRVAMETLARLSLRLNPDRAKAILRKGLAAYGNPLFHKGVLFRDPIRHLLSWPWEAVPEQDKPNLTLELLSAPIVGVDGYSPESYGWIDPAELIDGHDGVIPIRDEQNNNQWAATVSYLVRALTFDNEARIRSMMRIVQIALEKRLTAEEEASLATAIWSGDNDDEEALPGESKLKHWVYLCLPEPEPGHAEKWFRSKWLSVRELSNLNDESLDNMLFQIGEAIDQSRIRGFSFELNSEDIGYLKRVLLRWATAPIPMLVIPGFQRERIELMHNGIRAAAKLLMHLDVSDDIAVALYDKYLKYDESGVPAMLLLVSLVRSLKGRESDIHTEVRKGFSSADSTTVSSAALAMMFWLYYAGQSMVSRPPLELIREIGVIIVTRRLDALDAALSVAEWVFDHGEQTDHKEMRELAAEGLGLLIQELSYDRHPPKNADIPLLRWRCAALARAMRKRGCTESPVMNWITEAQKDPLPEVRNRISDILLKPEQNSAGT